MLPVWQRHTGSIYFWQEPIRKLPEVLELFSRLLPMREVGRENEMPRVNHQILIADPHVLFRRGLKTVLSNEPDFHVTDDCSSLDDLLAKLSENSGADIPYPDALLMCDQLLDQCSAQQAEVLEQVQTRSVLLALSSAGAAARPNAIARNASAAEMVMAVRQAIDVRRTGFSHSLTALRNQTEPSTDRLPALTSREIEIVRLLSEGLTARDTARELRLSIKTVEAHKLNVMRKLGVHKRSDLLRYAEENGLVQPASVA